MKKEEKKEIITEVAETVRKANGIFFTNFSGLTVGQATELRREFFKAGVQYRVVKNTLIREALKELSGYDTVFAKLVGPTGVAFAFDDPVAPAKIIQRFTEKHSKLSLKACVLEHQVYDGSRLKELSQLPSRKETMAAILGAVQSPIAGIAGAVNAVMRDLVSVVGEIEKKKAA
jgi:large subunit ribosomal protein L10